MGSSAIIENPETVGTETEDQPTALPGMQSQETGPVDGNINKNLPDAIKNWLKATVEKIQGQDKYPRRSEVIDARRQRFYDRGDQYVYWNDTAQVFMPITGGASVAVGSDAVDMPRYTDVYNIFHGYLRSLVALLAQNPPGVKFEPDDPKESVDITAAEVAGKFKHVVDRANNRQALQAEIARLFCTDARVLLYTRTVKDAQKFGKDETGMPKSGQFIEPYGVLESKVPITTDRQEDFHYVILSKELDIIKAKTDFPDFAKQITEGSSAMGESAYERFARLGVLQGTRLLFQTGDAFAHLVTRHYVWLRPSVLNTAPDEIKQEVLKLYPDGCRVTFCGGAYCGSWNESMDDHLTTGYPQPGDGQFRQSWMRPMVSVQDAYNDYKNMRKEYHDYGIPVTAWNQEAIDVQAFHEQVSEPGNNFNVTVTPNMKTSDMFAQTTALQPPGDLIEAEQDLFGNLAQFLTAVFPALFGGDTGQNDTLGGIAIQRDQAMGNMGLPWAGIQGLFARAYKQAVMCAAEEAADDQMVNINIPGKHGGKVETLALADLKKGNFHCYPDTDSSFPETWSAKKNAIINFFTAAEQNPVLLEAAVEPDNLEMFKQYSGVEDMVIPGAEALVRQEREIEELLQAQPVPPSQQELMAAAAQHAQAVTMSQSTGMPVPPPPSPDSMMKPSVSANPWDYHLYHAKKVQSWLESPERTAQEKAGNLMGIKNVELHGLEHLSFLKQFGPNGIIGLAAQPPMPPLGAPSAAPPPSNGAQPQPASGSLQ